MAAPLVTAPLRGDLGESFECRVVNVDSIPQAVTVELLDDYGTVTQTTGPCTLPPGEGMACGCFLGVGFFTGGQAYCRITGNKPRLLRGALLLVNNPSNSIRLALPAR